MNSQPQRNTARSARLVRLGNLPAYPGRAALGFRNRQIIRPAQSASGPPLRGALPARVDPGQRYGAQGAHRTPTVLPSAFLTFRGIHIDVHLAGQLHQLIHHLRLSSTVSKPVAGDPVVPAEVQRSPEPDPRSGAANAEQAARSAE